MPSSDWSSDVRSRSEEHTSELQSHDNLVCRLLLDKTIRSPPVVDSREHSLRESVPLGTPRARGGGGWSDTSSASISLQGGKPVGARPFFFRYRAPPEIPPFPLRRPFPL